MKTLNKTLLAATLVSGLGMASSSAMAASEFQVDESQFVPTFGSLEPGIVTADALVGEYVEKVQLTSANTFATSLQWNATGFANSAVSGAVETFINTPAIGYGIYALFQGQGTFVSSLVDGNVATTFTFTSGSFDLYVDRDGDTEFTSPATGSDPFLTTFSTDDDLLGFGDVLFGSGTQNCANLESEDCGSFGTTTGFELTDLGRDYFVSPVPFYNVAIESGNFNGIDLTNLTTAQDVAGNMGVRFNNNVPEPASIALMGLGFIGLGFAGRKKAK